MVDPELLEILVCPETKQPLDVADEDTLDRVNRAIEEGRLRTKGGERVDARLEGGLVRKDGEVLYPVRDDIPIMLVDEAIPVKDLR
jgi:uncharacterized protein YbaR (Trm112 family)